MGFAPIPAVTEPPKLLGSPTVVLVQRTSGNPVDAPDHSTSSVSVSFTSPKSVSPIDKFGICILYLSQERFTHHTDITAHRRNE
jgi:hypothetical protein